MDLSTRKQTKTITEVTVATDHVGVSARDLPSLNTLSIFIFFCKPLNPTLYFLNIAQYLWGYQQFYSWKFKILYPKKSIKEQIVEELSNFIKYKMRSINYGINCNITVNGTISTIEKLMIFSNLQLK